MKGPSFKHNIDGFSVKSYPHSKHEKCKRRVPGGFVFIVKDNIKKHVKAVKQNDHVLWLRLTNLIEGIMNTVCVPCISHRRKVYLEIYSRY